MYRAKASVVHGPSSLAVPRHYGGMPVEVESGADPLYSGDQVPVIQGARIGA